MALEVKKGTFNARTSAGSQSVSGVGFPPAAVIVWSSANLAGGVFGFVGCFATGQWVTSHSLIDISTTDLSGWGDFYDDACIYGRNSPSAGSSYFRAFAVSLDAGGFTLEWVGNISGTAFPIHYLAIGGDDVTAADSGTFTLNSGTGSKSISGVGFLPDFVFLGGITDGPTEGTQSLLVGAASGVGQEGAIGCGAFDPGVVAATRRLSGSRIITGAKGIAGEPVVEADLTSFNSGGFTINVGTKGFTDLSPFGYLCLQGGKYRVGKTTARTSVGTTATTGLGQSPNGLMLLTTATPTEDSTQGHWVHGIGASDGVSEGCSWDFVQDGTINQAIAGAGSVTTKVIRHVSETAGATTHEADVQSLDADGFTLNWTTAGSDADDFVYIAFGDEAAPMLLSGVSIPKAVGTPTIRSGITLSGVAIAKAVGSPLLDQNIQMPGVVIPRVVGTPSTVIYLSVPGVAVPAAVGSPTLTSGIELSGFLIPLTIGELRWASDWTEIFLAGVPIPVGVGPLPVLLPSDFIVSQKERRLVVYLEDGQLFVRLRG